MEFKITDTGIGIPADKQSNIFEVFMQADGSTTRKYGGTGLGLAVSRQLIRLMGGDITFTSQEGKGSTFTITVPANSVKVKNQESSQTNNSGEENEEYNGRFSGRILVVEDSPTNQTLIKILLEKLGFVVTIASDGCEAVNAVNGQEFSLIFMDMQLPNMNGYDATKKLHNLGVKTPIIAITAGLMNEDEDKCLQTGCDDYLPKPINRSNLIKTICKYMAPAATVQIA